MARSSKGSTTRSRSRSKQIGQAQPLLPASASLDSAKLRQLYSTMLGSRMLVERATLLTSQGVFAREFSVSRGLEAVEAASLTNLNGEDCVACGARDYVARFIQGTLAERIVASLGRLDGAGEGEVEWLLPGSKVANQLNQLTGVAWAFKLQKKPQVAVFLGLEPNSWSHYLAEAVNVSAVYRLPVVYVIHNGSVESPNRGNREIATKGPELDSYKGLACFLVDAADAVAVYRVSQEAIRRARQGHGPSLIECKTWTGSGISASTGISADAIDDPLPRMEAYLRSRNLWSEKWKTKLVHKFTLQIDRATAVAERALQQRRFTPITSSTFIKSTASAGGAQPSEDNCTPTAADRDTRRLAGSRR